MAYLGNIKIPGIPSKGLEFDEKLNSPSLNNVLKEFIEDNIIFNYSSRSPSGWSKILDFDTGYLEKASQKGTEENEFFTGYISPVLKKMRKENDPSKLLNFYKQVQENPSMFGKSYPDTKNIKKFDSINPYMFLTMSQRIGNPDDIKKASKELKDISKYLLSKNSFIENFDGRDLRSVSKQKVKDVMLFLKRMMDESESDEEKKNIKNIIRSINKSNLSSGPSQKAYLALEFIVDDMVDIDGKKFDNSLIFPFPLVNIPKNEPFLEPLETPDGEIVGYDYISSEMNDTNLYDNYLDLNKISNHLPSGYKYKDILRAFINAVNRQSEKNNKIDFTFNVAPREYLDDIKSEKELIDYTTKFLRYLNQDDPAVDFINPVYQKNKHKESSTIEYLKKLGAVSEDDFMQKNSEYDVDIDQLIPVNDLDADEPVEIPINTISSRIGLSLFKDVGNTNKAEEEIYKLASKGKATNRDELQRQINNLLSKEESRKAGFIGPYVSNALSDGGKAKRMRKYFLSDSDGNLITRDYNITDEHLVPMDELGKILNSFYEESFENDVPPDEIKKGLVAIIKSIYGRVFLDSQADSEMTTADFKEKSPEGLFFNIDTKKLESEFFKSS